MSAPIGEAALARRKGERFAAWMQRWREADIFDPWPPVLDGEHAHPFRIGIHQDLEPRLDQSRCDVATLHQLLGQLCRSHGYLVGLGKKGAMRHDIDGNPVEPVSDAHREGARACLKARQKRRQERERPAGANAAKPVLRLVRSSSARPGA